MSKLSYVPLTAEDLRAMNACTEQVKVFERVFPNGATPDDIDAAIAAKFDIGWLTMWFDEEQYLAAINPAREQYVAAIKPAEEQYAAAINNPAREQYDAAIKSAWEQYLAATKPAEEQYDAVSQPIAIELLRSCWPVWEE